MKKNGLHINESGIKYWYKEGKFHREDGPAVIYANGIHIWYKENKVHRDAGPAIIWPDGAQRWFKNGEEYEPTAHELMVWKMKEKEQTKNKTCQQAPHPQKPRKRTPTRTNTKRNQLSRTSKS